MRKLVLFSVLILFGCHYHTDKLKIINNSEKEIYYFPMLKDPEDNVYYGVSMGGNIKSNEEHSPKLIGQIWHKMEQKESDKILYVVFFDKKYMEYVFENEEKIVYDKRFKVQKYPLKQLDSLNWTITYDGK